MYLFLAVAALYTYYLFNSEYLKQYFKTNEDKSCDNNNEINDSYLDEEINDEKPEPKEIELVETTNEKKSPTNDKFIEEEKGWSIW